MTDSEKKMKRYLLKIRRRLALPKKLKDRVMADFTSSVQARKEAGKTDADIYAEFGTPKEVAAVLNEQMKEYTYRKSPWRFLFAAFGVYGALHFLSGLLSRILFWIWKLEAMVRPDPSVSVGIIGGADGPTAVFVTVPRWTSYILPTVALIVGITGFVLLSRCKRK